MLTKTVLFQTAPILHRRDRGITRPFMLALLSVVTAAALSACGKTDDGQTVGQKVDTAIAASQKAAAEAKVKTQSAMAEAGVTLKDVAQKAEVSGKNLADKTEAKFDDVSITAAVTGELARDPDLSAFKISVNTKNGAVLLKGTAPTVTAKERAAVLAKAAKGVLSVDNQLTVTGS